MNVSLGAEVIRLPKTGQRVTVGQAEVRAVPEEHPVVLLLLNQSPLTKAEEVLHSQAVFPEEETKQRKIVMFMG